MAKKKIRPEVSKMLWTLNYMYNYIKANGPENDYDHYFALAHIDSVVQQIKRDKELKDNANKVYED